MQRLNIKLDPTRTGRDAQHLETGLRRLVIGQDDAVASLVNIYQMWQVGLCAPGRPVGNFLFLGPTGTGKTRIVEATAEVLVGNPRAAIKIDCGEFQHSHEIAKLIGSPPGYLGHRETHPLLSQEVLNQHHTEKIKLSFVLFDEIEKASDSLWNLLLGILDKATLTLGDNRKVDFSRAMIFMTSNLGAEQMVGQKNFGFQVFKDALIELKERQTNNTRVGVEAARRKFKPEFLNRIDKVAVFDPLGEEAIKKILDVELNLVQQRIFNARGASAYVFSLDERAKSLLIKNGFDIRYNARHLKRAIERDLVQPMSNLVATEQVRGGDWIKVTVVPEGDRLAFFREAEGLSVSELAATSPGATLVTEPTDSSVARSTRRG